MASMVDSLGFFYLVHGVLALIVAVISMLFLKNRFNDRAIKIILFFWVFNFVLPGIGYLMTIWIVYYLATVSYDKQLSHINYINMIEFENEFPEIQRIFGEGSMNNLLNNTSAPSSLKMKALVSLADNLSKSDVMLIKNALSDKNDEIRLYSFAIIDNLERGINSKIHKTLQKFLEASNEEKSMNAAGELAYLYWDMVYFELTDSNLKIFIIDEVKKYANIVLKADPHNKNMNILLGKTYMMLEEYTQSKHYFSLAVKEEKSRDFIIPYLAEIAFHQKDYKRVKTILNRTTELNTNALLHPIVAQWSRT